MEINKIVFDNLESLNDVIALLRVNNHFFWYISIKEWWYLTQQLEDRYDIEILDNQTIYSFLEQSKAFQVSQDTLHQCLLEYHEFSKLNINISFLLPMFYIDFDNHIFNSYLDESFSFDLYVPDGWQASIARSFPKHLEDFPVPCRYWIVNGYDLSKYIFEKYI